MKQVIVMRTDLNMRKGKMVVQGAHASLKVTLENLDDPRVKEWLDDKFTKVCVRANSVDEFENVVFRATQADLLVESIVDSGKTEFHGVPTVTCCAIGPDTDENLDPITGDLKLL